MPKETKCFQAPWLVDTIFMIWKVYWAIEISFSVLICSIGLIWSLRGRCSQGERPQEIYVIKWCSEKPCKKQTEALSECQS